MERKLSVTERRQLQLQELAFRIVLILMVLAFGAAVINANWRDRIAPVALMGIVGLLVSALWVYGSGKYSRVRDLTRGHTMWTPEFLAWQTAEKVSLERRWGMLAGLAKMFFISV